MKFDVIVGNPPYNAPNKGELGASTQIWPDFVEQSMKFINAGGYLCFIHPPAWRKPGHKLLRHFSEKKMLFVKFISKPDAVKIFNVQIRVDWYIIENTTSDKSFVTEVVDEDGIQHYMNLKEREFIPSRLITLIDSITAKSGESKFKVETCSFYSSSKKFISDKKDKLYRYPLIHTIRETGPEYLYSSKNDRGVFGVSKVIINGTWYPWAIFDVNGEYGVTQRSMFYPTTNSEEASNIISALKTPKFQEIMEATKWNVSAIMDHKFFNSLRSDFYTKFL